jgi:hypothetical protein
MALVGDAMSDEPIIDAHTHFFWPGYFPPEWFRAKAEQWGGRKWPPPPLEGMPGRIERGLEDPDATLLLKDLDNAGVQAAVCIGIDPWPSLSTTGPNDIRSHVQRQVDVLRSSDRLRGFVSSGGRSARPASAGSRSTRRTGTTPTTRRAGRSTGSAPISASRSCTTRLRCSTRWSPSTPTPC